jgi:hypothetical protein
VHRDDSTYEATSDDRDAAEHMTRRDGSDTRVVHTATCLNTKH